MGSRMPKALLIRESNQDASNLAKHVRGRGCECEFAASYQEACSLIEAQDLDLRLSPMGLRNSSPCHNQESGTRELGSPRRD